MLSAYVDLLLDRLLRGASLELCLTPLPASEQLAITLLVPRLRRWLWTEECN